MVLKVLEFMDLKQFMSYVTFYATVTTSCPIVEHNHGSNGTEQLWTKNKTFVTSSYVLSLKMR